MKLYQITVTEAAPPRVTRVVIGCEEPAREAFSSLCSILHGQGLVSFRIVEEMPQRTQEERDRAEAFMEMIFKQQERH